MSTNRVERVTPELVIPLHDLEDVELKSAIDARLLRIAVSVGLGREMGILDLGLDVWR